ncbi:MAG: Fur family transcriptional regulator [Leadbetterella sp.]
MEAKELLHSFGLRHTEMRERIVEKFMDNQRALSQNELENQLIDSFDRITVYRTLKSFNEAGLVHKVLDDSGTVKYALCTETCQQGQHDHSHVHFKCTSCDKTTCIHQIHIPKIDLPQGYSKKEMDVLIHGVCPSCNTK